jgi:hypothetical protein
MLNRIDFIRLFAMVHEQKPDYKFVLSLMEKSESRNSAGS